MPEVRNREKAALGNRAIAVQKRVGIGKPFVQSKLCYLLHVWPSFNGKAKSKTNNVYMRLWRRVANDMRFGRTKWTDKEGRLMLGVPSIESLLRFRHLTYLCRVARSVNELLEAHVKAVGPVCIHLFIISTRDKQSRKTDICRLLHA